MNLRCVDISGNSVKETSVLNVMTIQQAHLTFLLSAVSFHFISGVTLLTFFFVELAP
jgi:hypothetical protein